MNEITGFIKYWIGEIIAGLLMLRVFIRLYYRNH